VFGHLCTSVCYQSQSSCIWALRQKLEASALRFVVNRFALEQTLNIRRVPAKFVTH